MRLYDEKRQKINVGDKIEFTCRTDQTQSLMCEVIALHRFSSFAKLYESLPLDRCGCDDPKKANPDDMLSYYSEDEQKKYGVVGIEVKLL
jgi:ASC-1-like (ASCH) protein